MRKSDNSPTKEKWYAEEECDPSTSGVYIVVLRSGNYHSMTTLLWNGNRWNTMTGQKVLYWRPLPPFPKELKERKQ